MTDRADFFASDLGAFAVVTVEGEITGANRAFSQLTGRNPAVGPTLIESWFEPADWAAARAALEAAARGAVGEVEARLAGSERWCEWRFAPGESGRIYAALRDIGRRMNALATENLFREAFERGSEAAVIADAQASDLPIIHANDAFLTLTGYTRDEVIGRNCRFLNSGDVDQEGVRLLRDAVRFKRRARAQLRNYRKSGEAYLAEVSIYPLCDRRGVVTHFIGHQRDVTAAVEATDRLRASEARFRRFIESSDLIAWRFDVAAGRYAYVSAHAETVLGYPVEAWLTPGFWEEHVDPRDRKVAEALRRKHVSTGEGYVCEYRMLRADGGVVWLRDIMSGQPVGRPGDDGHDMVAIAAPRAIESFMIEGFMIDVTDRQIARQRAERNEAYLNAILETAPDAILTVDEALNIKSFNRAAEAVFGWPAAEMLGAPLSRLVPDPLGADRAPRHDALARGYVDDPEAATQLMGDWRRVKGLRRNGEAFPIMISLTRTVVEDMVSVTAIARDMTAIEKANRDLADLSSELAEQLIIANDANVAKTRFLASMSHELRTPLNAVIGFADLMSRELFGPLGDRRYLLYARDILASGQHLLALINDVLDLSRIEAGRANLTLEPLSLRPAAADALRLIRPLAQKADVALRAAIGRATPPVTADRRALNQILLNLLSNAVKFTPAGGRVTLRAEALCDRVRVSVADTGCGIPADQISRLGQPFEQVGDIYRAETKGTGLGLAITRSLAEAMGGGMAIESELGRGTTVTVTLLSAGSAAAAALTDR